MTFGSRCLSQQRSASKMTEGGWNKLENESCTRKHLGRLSSDIGLFSWEKFDGSAGLWSIFSVFGNPGPCLTPALQIPNSK